MKILVTPLDWGLGHATRCIPLVRALLASGCEVVIAGSGASLALLGAEFPALKRYALPGYRPTYPASQRMEWAMARQLPRFFKVIKAERRAVDDIVKREGVDAIISDNRYGCRSVKVPSVFITHQSNILMPRRFGWLSTTVRYLNLKYIDQFDRVWIPDQKGSASIAGELISFGDARIRPPVFHVGMLSRFRPTAPAPPIERDIILVLSGPEPQRTLLENIVVPQLAKSGLRYLVVRGLPAEEASTGDSRIMNFLASDALQSEIDRSSLVIARSGYSTVMDMHALGKRVVFVPTPGQTEQEYLGRRLMEKGIAFSAAQERFCLQDALKQSSRFTGFRPYADNDSLRPAIDDLLAVADSRKRS